MKKKKSGLINSILIWLLQLLGEGGFLFAVLQLNVLPGRFLVPVIAVLAVMLLITFLLLFVKRSKHKGRQTVRQIFAMLIAVVMMLGGVVGYLLISRVTKTIESSTGVALGGTTIGVYVLAEDSAVTITDAKDYTFGRSTSYDVENTARMVEHLNKVFEKEPAMKDYPMVADQVLGLYNKEVNAIVLNTAYIPVLEEAVVSADDNSESDVSFADFSTKAKLLYEFNLEAEVKEEPVEEKKDYSITEDPFIVYISGSDTRDKMLTVSRSDVNILAVVNPKTRQVLLLNTPRDYYIPNPAGNGALDKLTHCGIYGTDCSKKALSDFYGEEILYFSQINFTGFERLIDAFGGITVTSDVEFTTTNNHQIVVGENYLNGEDALAFVRERHNLQDGDNDRGKNQMKVIKALINQVSAGTLAAHYSEILDSLSGMFITDMPSADLLSLVKMQILDGGTWNVKSYAVTGSNAHNYTYSMPRTTSYVMIPNEDSVELARKLIRMVYDGSILGDADFMS